LFSEKEYPLHAKLELAYYAIAAELSIKFIGEACCVDLLREFGISWGSAHSNADDRSLHRTGSLPIYYNSST